MFKKYINGCNRAFHKIKNGNKICIFRLLDFPQELEY